MGIGHVRWLLEELPALVASGVLDPDAAERLRAHYRPQAGSRRRWVVLGLGIFGAALVGAGIAMLLAHNWDQLSRPARAAVALGLLVAAQALAGFARFGRPGSVAWREGAATGWVFATGGALGLVTQTYHVAVEVADFLALWTLLVLPIVWLLRSRVATALAWCGAAPATMMGVRTVAADGPVLFWGFAAILLPFMAWLATRLRDERLAVLPFWAVAAWLPIAGIAHTEVLGHATWRLWFPALFAGLYALGRRIEPAERSAAWRPLWLVGGAGTAVIVLILSFSDVWSGSPALHAGDRPAAWGVTVALMALAGLLAAWQAVVAARDGEWTAAALLGTPLVVGTLHLAVAQGAAGVVAAVACSAWLLLIGLLALVEGTRRGHIGMANVGLVFLAALATARFFDADLSLLARGVGFVAVGLAFLGMNVWLLRQRHEVHS